VSTIRELGTERLTQTALLFKLLGRCPVMIDFGPGFSR
jgi:hypothetical protein